MWNSMSEFHIMWNWNIWVPHHVKFRCEIQCNWFHMTHSKCHQFPLWISHECEIQWFNNWIPHSCEIKWSQLHIMWNSALFLASCEMAFWAVCAPDVGSETPQLRLSRTEFEMKTFICDDQSLVSNDWPLMDHTSAAIGHLLAASANDLFALKCPQWMGLVLSPIFGDCWWCPCSNDRLQPMSGQTLPMSDWSSPMNHSNSLDECSWRGQTISGSGSFRHLHWLTLVPSSSHWLILAHIFSQKMKNQFHCHQLCTIGLNTGLLWLNLTQHGSCWLTLAPIAKTFWFAFARQNALVLIVGLLQALIAWMKPIHTFSCTVCGDWNEVRSRCIYAHFFSNWL